MARQWRVIDNWEQGNHFADGSFNAKGHDLLNMQRYRNGSVGPRPGWRKLTNTAGSGTVPSVANANKANLTKYGADFIHYGSATNGYLQLHGGNVSATARRLAIGATGSAVYNTTVNTAYNATGAIAIDMMGGMELQNIMGVHIEDSLQTNAIFIGCTVWAPNSGASGLLGTVAYRTIGGSVFKASKAILYRGRVFQWDPAGTGGALGARSDYIAYSRSDISSNFTTGDSGDFQLASQEAAVALGTAGEVQGLWALQGGLLIYSSLGPAVRTTGYTANNTLLPAEMGRWFILTGATPASGTLNHLADDIGPQAYSLSTKHDGRVLFPVEGAGWVVHDGTKLDKTSLASIRPGKGAKVTGSIWLPPHSTKGVPSLILPYYTSTVDPTASGTGTTDRIGEFWNTGYGAFEFVNDTWTEALYNHGQGDYIAQGQFGVDRLFRIDADSSDAGANWFPQPYIRDVTLDRPAVSSSIDTYNPYSSGTETAPTQAGGATGVPKHQLTTGEVRGDNGSHIELQAIQIEYDYWNSSVFQSGCGFEVDILYRGLDGSAKLENLTTTSPVTPEATSTAVYPNRATVILHLPSYIPARTFQIRIKNLVGCAIHSIAYGFDLQADR